MLRRAAFTLLLSVPLSLGCSANAGGGGFGPDDDSGTDDGAMADSPVTADSPAGGDSPVAADSPARADSPVTTDSPAPGDGGYTEPLCDDTADLSQLASTYVNTPAGLRAAVHGIAERRYPIGVAFIDGQTDMQLMTWFSMRGAFANVLNSFEVGVHEGGHIWDFGHSSGSTVSYRLRDDLVIQTRRLNNFNRSEILPLHTNPSADIYATQYLTGQLGAQGFGTLLDEYVQYVHSIASRYCTREGLPAGQSISTRDGILTFMYYVELYLKVARTMHPDAYAAIVGDPGHIQLIRTNWARAEFWLNLSAPYRNLGIRDAQIRTWTYAPENLMEITMLPQ